MKKQIITASLLTISYLGFGQYWNTNGTNIFNTNTGNVKIGNTAAAPKQRLDVGGNIALSGNGELVYDNTNGILNWGHGGVGDLLFKVMNFQGNLSQGAVTKMRLEGATGNLNLEGNLVTKGTHVVFNSLHGVIDWGAGGAGDLFFRTLSTQGDINTYTDRMRIATNSWINMGNGSYPSDQLQVQTTNNASGITISQGNTSIPCALTLNNAAGGRTYSLRSSSNSKFSINDNNLNTERFVIDGNGNVGIATSNPYAKLTVNGNVLIGSQHVVGSHSDAILQVSGKLACMSLYVLKPTTWMDKVFNEEYKQLSLGEVEEYIKENKHLPNIKSEIEVLSSGYDINEMDAALLEKIENLYLYVIQQQKEIDKLKKEISVKIEN